MKDYYKILGLDKNASESDIKKAYRKLAVEYHPDKNVGKTDQSEKFKEISEAYETLSDKDKKASYDRPNTFGNDAFSGAWSSAFGGTNGNDFADFFKSGFRSAHSSYQPTKKGRNINSSIAISLEEMMSGVTRRIKLTRNTSCGTCDGTGSTTKSIGSCIACGGMGIRTRMVQHVFGDTMVQETCTACKGSGIIIKDKCGTCSSTGTVQTEDEIDVKIPKGSLPGMSFVVNGKGNYERLPCEPGDLIINIDEYVHPVFRRDGINLIHEHMISFKEACLGTEISIKNLNDSHYKLKIPGGTSAGKIFRLLGKGLPEFNGFMSGDILIKVDIKIPSELNDEQIKALDLF